MVTLKLNRARSWFAPQFVVRAFNSAKRRVLFKQAGYVRRVAYNSLRKKPKSARPGQIPHSHTHAIKNFTRFAIPAGGEWAIIGPRWIPLKMTKAQRQLEHSGHGWARVQTGRGGELKPPPRRRRRRRKTGTPPQKRQAKRQARKKPERLRFRRVYYRARPFMVPALNKSLPRITQMWENQIRRV